MAKNTKKLKQEEKDHLYNMVCPNTHLPAPEIEESLRNSLKQGNVETRTLIDKLYFTFKVSEDCYNIDIFIKLIIDYLDEYFDLNLEQSVPVTSGYGFNNGMAIPLGKSRAKIIIKYFDPAKTERLDGEYLSGSAMANAIRQGVQVQFTGDSLQNLRANGEFYSFLVDLTKNWSVTCTQIDLSLDVFNSPIKPIHFAKLYEQEKYTGRSKVSVFGEYTNPTVYIGVIRTNKCIMLYDKKQENIDSGKKDEPELFDLCKEWLRIEIKVTRDRGDAQTVLDYLLSAGEEEFSVRIGQAMNKIMREKCRFLKERKDSKSNPDRIATDSYWLQLLSLSNTAEIDFATHRPELGLEERTKNFIYKSIGGANFLRDYYDELGPEKTIELVSRIVGRPGIFTME